MSETKTRVSMLSPKSTHLWLALGFLFACMSVWAGLRYWRGLDEAIPMKGDCKEIPMKHYDKDDKDGQTCVWKDKMYWCVYDTIRSKWACDIILPEPPAAEKK